MEIMKGFSDRSVTYEETGTKQIPHSCVWTGLVENDKQPII